MLYKTKEIKKIKCFIYKNKKKYFFYNINSKKKIRPSK